MWIVYAAVITISGCMIILYRGAVVTKTVISVAIIIGIVRNITA